jgi:hypothetical protein
VAIGAKLEKWRLSGALKTSTSLSDDDMARLQSGVEIINAFVKRYAQCPNCRVKFLYNIAQMRRANKATWPYFKCPNRHEDTNASCDGLIVDYEEPLNSVDERERLERLLYRNYTSPLVVTATLMARGSTS